MRRFFASFFEVVEVAVIAIGAVFLVRSFLLQPFLVSGASMVPTFSNGDYLLIDELTYRIRPPERGEVIVFRYPRDESVFFIKRIIGLPGETVAAKDGKVIIKNSAKPDGYALDESYLPPSFVVSGDFEVTLGSGEYFVLGDNRSFSYDSRGWGTLPAKDIVGLVRVRLWPVSSMQAFAAPRYSY